MPMMDRRAATAHDGRVAKRGVLASLMMRNSHGKASIPAGGEE